MEKSKKKEEKKKKTHFQNIWLDEPEMKEWICKGTDDTKFSCKWCKVTDLNLSNSGRKAVVSHMNTAKHKAQARAVKRKSMDSLSIRGGDIKKLSDTLAMMHDKRRKMH